MTGLFLNIAGYRFVPLTELPRRRAVLRRLGRELDLRGTVLLSPEGINLFLAGLPEAIHAFLEQLEEDTATQGMTFKRSMSEQQPFRRYLVKVKAEIIPFGVAEASPAICAAAPEISPRELKEWLDEKKDFVLLDVRNDYEVAVGTFHDAHTMPISNFRQFPQAVNNFPDKWKDTCIVTFCTGGIRCEKAAPYLRQHGFLNARQLKGGILQYFEECGSAHFRGDCFVFDQRVALNADLAETDTTQCFACQAVVTPSEQKLPSYIPGISCPHCGTGDGTERRIQTLNCQIQDLLRTLPGSQPYTNHRTLYVPAEDDGKTLIEFVTSRFPFAERDAWLNRIRQGWLLRDDAPLQEGDVVCVGQRLEHLFPDTLEPPIARDLTILHDDEAIVVVHKPAPMPCHPCGRFNRHSMIWILNRIFAPRELRLAHRLDANTTGIVVLTKSARIARKVQPQFEARTPTKTYLARVHGHPALDEFDCSASISVLPVRTGARVVEERGLSAYTHFRVIRRFRDGTSLLEVRPTTGRTNQIRVHLWHLGFPIVGDGTYLPEGRLGAHQTLGIDDPPLCLHAHQLKLRHPLTSEVVDFAAPAPSWCAADYDPT